MWRDLSLKDDTEERLENIQQQVQKKSLTEIPNFKSIQYFQFDENADTKAIADRKSLNREGYDAIKKYMEMDAKAPLTAPAHAYIHFILK